MLEGTDSVCVAVIGPTRARHPASRARPPPDLLGSLIVRGPIDKRFLSVKDSLFITARPIGICYRYRSPIDRGGTYRFPLSIELLQFNAILFIRIRPLDDRFSDRFLATPEAAEDGISDILIASDSIVFVVLINYNLDSPTQGIG